MHEDIVKAKESVCREIGKWAKQFEGRELSPSAVDIIYKLAVAVEKLKKYEVLEEESMSDYSDEYSERRRRDSRGRYSRDGGSSYMGGSSYDDDSSYGGYSSRRRYSRDEGQKIDKQGMIDLLEDMNGKISSSEGREALEACISRLKRM